MFNLGDHVRVNRNRRVVGVSIAYWHHGIVVAPDEVVDFGGGDFLHKGKTEVRRVTLSTFEGPSQAEVVVHPITWQGLTYSDQLSSEETVDRALWLVDNQPPIYRLGYRNCESIAIWCATGDYESFQVKRFLLLRTPLSLIVPYALRTKRRLGIFLGAVSISISLVTAVPYIMDRRFFDHTCRYPGPGKWPPNT